MSMHLMTSFMTKNYLQFPRNGAFFYDIYMINDIIMYSNIIYFPVFIS